MSSSTSAIKASKSIVESYISSDSEKSNLTTSFTSHSSASDVDSKTNGIINKIMEYVQHPKFKWVIIAILLCIFAFIYFKTQAKPVKKDAKADAKKDNLNVRLNKNGHPELVEKDKQDKQVAFGFKDKELQQKLEQLDNKQQQQFFMKQMQQQMQPQQPQHHHHQQAPPQHHQHQAQQQAQQQAPQQAPQQAQQQAQQQAPPPVSQQVELDASESDDSSEEVFIENENIMNHNLTREEMNAIDRQLEDVLE
jgi:FtsZ-interacting cell division protein ZipA